MSSSREGSVLESEKTDRPSILISKETPHKMVDLDCPQEEFETNGNKHLKPHFLAILIDPLIPILLILSSISCMSVMGMIFIIILYIHVLICNKMKKSFNLLIICLLINLMFHIVAFVFSIIAMTREMEEEAYKILGFDFNNVIISSPILTLVTSLIAIICQIGAMVLIKYTRLEEFMALRSKIFTSVVFQFIIDFLWEFSNAFNNSSNLSYLSLPLLLYLISSVISTSLTGVNHIPHYVVWGVMIYSLFYALYEVFMLSYIGGKFNFYSSIRYNYIGPTNSIAGNYIFAVVFSYLSVQNLSAPGHLLSEMKQIPAAIIRISNYLLYLAFLLNFLFGLFYPNYLSILWIIITLCASFVRIKALKRFFFPLLSIVFTISFVAIVLTTFEMFDRPINDGTDYYIEFLKLFGFFRYSGDFTFSLCGFLLIVFYGILGRITNSNSKEKRKKKEKTKTHQNIKRIGIYIYLFFHYLSVMVIIVIGITGSFYENRFAFIVFGCFLLIIVLCALFNRTIFISLKVLLIIMILSATYFKITVTNNCINNECLSFGHFGTFQEMIQTGLVAPADMSLPEYFWPYIVVYVLCTFLNFDEKALSSNIPSNVNSILYFIIGVLQFIHLFLYDTDIFSLFFILFGILTLAALYLQKNQFVRAVSSISSIVITILLTVYYLSHFDGPRNLITTYIPPNVINISKKKLPSIEIAILAAILFLTTISFFSKPGESRTGMFFERIFIEIRVMFNYMDFYLCWVFIFVFSIVNDNPSLIKFILMLFFGFGELANPLFQKIRAPFMIFNILYLLAQLICDIFDFDNPKNSYFDILRYVGLYFSPIGKPSIRERNMSIIWQLACILLGVICSKPFVKQQKDPNFEKLISTKLYRALVALLHYFSPVIVLASLCVSTMYNQSMFGWFTFIITVLLTYKTKILEKKKQLITGLFNFLFVVYYLLYLGYPSAITNTNFNIFNYIDDDKRETLSEWMRWFGVYDIKTSSLVANCISAFVLTLYLHFNKFEVNYRKYYFKLPSFLKHSVQLFVTYNFEIIMTLILIIVTNIRTLDGVLYFFLTGVLLTLNILFDFDKNRTLTLCSASTFMIISCRLLSRMPIFTDSGIGKYIKDAFDLPFNGDAKFRDLWTSIYVMEKICLHIMKSDLFKEFEKQKNYHHAFRFIRSRQLRIIYQLDQQIIAKMDLVEKQKMRSLNENNFDDLLYNLEKDSPIMPKECFSETSSTTQFSDEKKKSKFQKFLLKWVKWFIKRSILFIAASFNPNCESGINALTMDSIIQVMKRHLQGYEKEQHHVFTEEDYEFYKSLPPSFPLHFQSITDAIGSKMFRNKDSMDLLMRYLAMLIRRIPFTLLLLTILVYVFTKPYVFSLIILLLFIILFCSINTPCKCIKYRIFLPDVLIILFLRNISTMTILEPYILSTVSSIDVQRMQLSPLKMCGVDSTDSSSVVEVFLLIFTIFYTVEQLSWCDVYPPKYYLNKFMKSVENFPYCCNYDGKLFGDDPVATLALNAESLPLKSQIAFAESNRGLIITSHSFVSTLIDMICFVLLAILWTTWTSGDENNLLSSAASFSFQIDFLFIFVLICHVVFMLAYIYMHLAKNLLSMFILNVIWLLYTYCMSFFYIPSVNRNYNKGSLYLYVFLRILSALITCHRVSRGKKVVEYQFPSFRKEWRRIIFANNFILICPFIFEIECVLNWMSHDTYVGILDFMMIRDVSMRLEILISSQMDPHADDPPEKERNWIIGGGILLIFLALLFGPLFFMTSGSGATLPNPPLSATLQVGIAPFPPFYQSSAEIFPISKGQMQDISNAKLSALRVLILNSNEDSTILSFPRIPTSFWLPDLNSLELQNVIDTIGRSELYPYYNFILQFNRQTTTSNNQEVNLYYKYQALTDEEKNTFSRIIQRNIRGSFLHLDLPLAVLVPTTDTVVEASSDFDRNVSFTLSSSTSEFIEMIPQNTTDPKVGFLASNDLRILLWSQPVSSDNILGSFIDDNGGIAGIYLLIIVTFGLMIRNNATGQLDLLWIDRMERPQQLYRIIVAIYSYRLSNESENELLITNNLLETLRSKETCIKLTSAPELEK
ncbi:hypothetical protein TRFO_29340 [Tritrichomonas foetus]|uniref:Piezo non-specific cation channel cap domain-containing protein n=1 Tax=Tritrichomonas foetus TaxID=1144522 RepID=A0A1J4JXA8_9EUKA|nr:hypothetical protein TRFO_29340 [Tritrichomonas foetus]|eukprot:OHT03298.1 hypothetical protein TRFO_29340 [Tritrichomonas foetus]